MEAMGPLVPHTLSAPCASRMDIAGVIDECLAQPTEMSIAVATVALYRHKRAHPGDTDASLLEGALECAKRVCRRVD
jgi:hypothetical protein